MQAVFIQGRGQCGSDLPQQLQVLLDRSEIAGDPCVLLQKSAGMV